MEKVSQGWFSLQSEKFEQSRFATMAILLTAQSCAGGFAAMFALQNNSYVSLGFAAVVCMLSNAAFIAQAPAKWCMALFYTCIFTNIAVITYNIL